MKKILVVLLALALSCSPVLGNDLDPDFVKVYEAGKKASVTFDHKVHSAQMGECADCHGQLEAFGGSVNKKFAHAVCKDCHKNVVNLYPNAPVSCTGCHVK